MLSNRNLVSSGWLRCEGLPGFLVNVITDTGHLSASSQLHFNPTQQHQQQHIFFQFTSRLTVVSKQCNTHAHTHIQTVNKKDQSLKETWLCEVFVCSGTVPLCNPCLLSLWSGIMYLSVQNNWANKQLVYWWAAAWNMCAAFTAQRKEGAEWKREQSKSVKESIMLCPNRERPPQWPY